MTFNEEILIVREKPLTLMLKLPGGSKPGRWEAAEDFANIIAVVHQQYPDTQFQFIPFSFESYTNGMNPALKTILAVAT